MNYKYGELVTYQDSESGNQICVGKIISQDKDGKYTLLMQTGVGGTRHKVHKSEIKEFKQTPSK